jgi:hypothetical protein
MEPLPFYSQLMSYTKTLRKISNGSSCNLILMVEELMSIDSKLAITYFHLKLAGNF